MNESLLSVHRVLEYLITKATVSGKLKSTKIRIPYSELADSVGQKSYKNVDLIVKIDFEWDESKELEQIELDAFMDEEDEDVD